MNKKELEKDLTENKSDDLAKEESEEIKEETHKKKHTKLKVLLVFCLIFLGAAGYSYYLGVWNPFKEKEISKVAEKNYEESLDFSKEWARATGAPVDEEYYQADNDAFPYGFMIEDYGKEGRMGCLKKMSTVSSSYSAMYGMRWDMYYMKNQDYATEKYLSFISGKTKHNTKYIEEKIISDTERVFFYLDNAGTNFYMLHGSTVYDMWGVEKNLDINQKFFDYLKVKYKVPTMKEIENKMNK